MQKEKEEDFYLERVQDFCIERKLNYCLYSTGCNSDVTTINDLRMYLEREGIPHNYLESPSELSKKFVQKLMKKRFAQHNLHQINKKIQLDYSNNVAKKQHEELFKQFKQFTYEERESRKEMGREFKSNREILTKVFYRILMDGLLQLKKLKPSDPFEYLSEFVFEKTLDETDS